MACELGAAGGTGRDGFWRAGCGGRDGMGWTGQTKLDVLDGWKHMDLDGS